MNTEQNTNTAENGGSALTDGLYLQSSCCFKVAGAMSKMLRMRPEAGSRHNNGKRPGAARISNWQAGGGSFVGIMQN
ncbi:MAG: hypothetical protein ACXWT0_00285 [Methylobacter sp.]